MFSRYFLQNSEKSQVSDIWRFYSNLFSHFIGIPRKSLFNLLNYFSDTLLEYKVRDSLVAETLPDLGLPLLER